MDIISLFGALVLVWISILLNADELLSQPILPNQPVQFQSRPLNPQPFLVYSFRQSVCVSADNLLQPDVGGALPISRLASATTCPSRGDPNIFDNAMIGYTVTNATDRNAIMSTAIGTSFGSLTEDPGSTGRKKMSVEVWFSSDVPLEDDTEYTLVEIGSLASGVDSVSASGHQLKVTYKKRSNADQLFVEYLYRTPLVSTDATVTVDIDSLLFDKLEDVGTSPGQVFMLILSIASTNDVTAHLGDLGGTRISKMEERSNEVRRFVFPDTSRLRVGCTRTTNGRTGFPGSVHFLAFYNDTIDESTAEILLDAGLPNSLPAVRSISFLRNEDEEDDLNLNVTNEIVYDFDNNPVSRFRILTRPNKGQLKYGGTPITVDNFPVLNPALLTYVSDLDGFSVAEGAGTCSGVYTTFTFDASDGLCDHTTTQQNLNNDDCNSPVLATATICVRERNDAPDITGSEGPFTVFAEAANPNAFSITCRDRDTDNATFGLDRVVLMGQSNATLGKIYVVEHGTGDCEGGQLIEDFAALDNGEMAVNMSRGVGKNEDYTWSFCYNASATTVTTVDVGTDNITYRCYDRDGGFKEGIVQVAVKNALIAGCGTPSTSRADWAAGVPCNVVAMEDEPMFVTLTGLDVVTDHTSENRRYKIVTLPPVGTLTLLNGTAVTAGHIIEANNGSEVDVVGIEGVPKYNTTDGNLTLIYRPALNHFTAICCLDTDPNPLTSVERHATCPSSSCVSKRFKDALDVPFNGCANPAGCPVKFSFALGYLDVSDVLSFSDTFHDGFRITVLGVNDVVNETYLRLPSRLNMTKTLNNYFINEIQEGLQAGYYDPDGDTFRVGFQLRFEESRTSLIIPEPFDNPLVDEVNTRLSWLFGGDCFELGRTSCQFQGKAYQSDLNRMIAQLAIRTTTTSRLQNDTLLFAIYDPVQEPYDFDQGTYFSLDAANVSKEMFIQFGSGTDGSDNYGLISAALWAGIGAGLFFVAMSCFAFWGCIISRAKRGEEAAVWAVKNLLCTDVEHRHNVDLSKMATGGRKSLEHAIHAEHARLARVVCCALFMHKMCPCLVKFDDKDLKVPDEESMLQEAVNQTRKRIASLHRPKDSPDGAIPVAKAVDPDVEDVVKEDELADDSIFDWERHLDEKTGRVFYYNIKTHESRWKPPTVKVHEQRKIADRTSVKGEALFQPRPPEGPKNNGNNGVADDSEADRVKKAS